MFLDFSSIPEVAVSHFKGGQSFPAISKGLPSLEQKMASPFCFTDAFPGSPGWRQ